MQNFRGTNKEYYGYNTVKMRCARTAANQILKSFGHAIMLPYKGGLVKGGHVNPIVLQMI